MKILTELFESVDLRGHGGKEYEIIKLFPDLQLDKSSIYDARSNNCVVEFKKISQKTSPYSWIDPVKLIDLTPEELKIPVFLFRFDLKTGYVKEVYSETYEELLRKVAPNVMAAARLCISSPNTQLKVKIIFTNQIESPKQIETEKRIIGFDK